MSYSSAGGHSRLVRSLIYLVITALAVLFLFRGGTSLSSQDTADYEDQLDKVLQQAKRAWQQLAADDQLQKIDVDRTAVATQLAGVQHDTIWRPGFLKDTADHYQRRERENSAGAIDDDQAWQMALGEPRPKPIPGHEKYASRDLAEQAAQALRDDGMPGISVQTTEEKGASPDAASATRYAVCQNINTQSKNIHPKLNYQLNGALTSAYVDATVEFLNQLISARGERGRQLPDNLATVQGERIHQIWMEKNRWELNYNVLPRADKLKARFQQEFGTADAEQVDIVRIVTLVDSLTDADYEQLDADVKTKLLQFRPYDRIGRREQVKDDLMGVQAVLMILNAALKDATAGAKG
jgi:flagellar biosynthesis chaperone FliJ